MKNFNNNFLFKIISILLIFIVSIISFNYFYDPFTIFGKLEYENIKNKTIFTNERYAKMKYILSNKDKYDSFLFGSCSCYLMNLQNISNGTWYTMTYADNTLYDVRRVLEFMLSTKISPQKIIVQISDAGLKDSFDGAKYRCKKILNYCPYPISTKEKIRFYGLYLLSLPFYNYYFWDKWSTVTKTNLFKDGSWAKTLATNPSQSEKTKLNKFKNIEYIQDDYQYEQLEELKKIYSLCVQNNIKFELFIIPEYIEVYNLIDLKKFNDIKRKIVQITPFYDFTGVNDITVNKFNFIDPFHVNNWTSKLIIDRLFYENKNEEPSIRGFGVYVTQRNVDKHIKNLENEINNYNKHNRIEKNYAI